MIIRRSILALTFVLPFALITCAGPEGDPPSLATRPVEGILDEPVWGIAPVESASDTALASQIARLIGQARAGDRNFAAAYPVAQQAVGAAAGSPAESEAWIAAQLAMSALDSARAETIRALGLLDLIFAEQAISGSPAETERLIEGRREVAALHDGQNSRHDALNARLRSR